MTFEQFREKFNIDMTEQQNEAIHATKGAVLLLAVPGSGKTTVLVTRLGYMIYCQNIAPEAILTMTYTVAAANDMRSRFRSIFGSEMCDRLEFRTINGVCAKILRRYERASGSRVFDLISDEKELASLVSSIYREATGDFPSESDIKNARMLITYAKNMMLSEREIATLEKQCPRFCEIHRRYCDELRRRRLMDYDDQLVYAHNILQRYPAILSQVQSQYKYICVDEAQDTSRVQHKIIALIAKSSGNLFMVGDEDQSIYGFRAAYPDALVDFQQQYEGARVLLMEQNFRSNAHIVRAANAFIGKNRDRHEKNMLAFRPEGEHIAELFVKDRTSQYARIADHTRSIEGEAAILYRDNESALPLIDLFERRGIPYRMKAVDISFFSNRVIQDIRGIIELSTDPYNTELFQQLYYKLATYLSKSLAMAACEISRQEHTTVWDAVFSLDELTAGAERGCKTIKAQLERLQHERADRAVSRIYTQMGYSEYLDRMGIKPHKIAILEAIGANEPSPAALCLRLDQLRQIIGNAHYDPNCKLILSTIHSSKGLEYDTVYLIDACDGIFPETVIHPGQKADRELMSTYEEERRIFYVGVTRAKDRLYLLTYGNEDSSFCNELLGRNDIRSEKSGAGASARSEYVGVEKPTYLSSISESAPDYAKFSDLLSVGTQIRHKLFGIGVVTARSGEVIEVEFSGNVKKKLSLRASFAQRLIEMHT